MLTLPLPQEKAFYSVRAELDGTNYTLGFSWVERSSLWHLSVSTDDGTLLVSGIGIVTNRPLLRRFHYIPGMPQGDLLFIDPTEAFTPGPGYGELDKLWYTTEGEFD